MKHFYIFTGYDRRKNKLSTQKRYDIQSIADIINYYSPGTIKSLHDF